MMKIVLDHPTPAEEMMILDRMAVDPPVAEQVIDLDELIALQRRRPTRVRRPQRRPVRRRPRPGHPQPRRVRPRRARPVDRARRQPTRQLNLVRGARALALIRGRTYATPQDVFDVAPEVLRHRLLLTYDALARDITPDLIVNRILETVPATWVSPKPNDALG